MCIVSKKIFIGVGDIHPDGQNFPNMFSIWANKNDDKSAIMNLMRTKLHRIHGRIVVNACVEYLEEMYIGVGDIHPDGQISDGRTDPKSLSPNKNKLFGGW